ncbi:MAG: GntR family transcriptional regulator [Bradyrhizobiaceae bacterium]|nr:MAG: GntR family transcriptional regulator [Bradyrhizobiaceae bacterium]
MKRSTSNSPVGGKASNPGAPDSPIRDRLVEDLREGIRTLRLPPAMKLTTEHLRKRFAVSQSSIREALSALCGEGLIERESRRGFRVKSMSVQDFRDLTEMRIALEIVLLGQAIELARPRWKVELASALRAILPNDHRVGDARPLDATWEVDHRRFHYALLDGYRAPIQHRFLDTIYDQFDRYRTLSIPRRAFLANTATDHQEMSEAAIAGDLERASQILTRHIRDTSRAIQMNIETWGLAERTGNIVAKVIEDGDGQMVVAITTE